MTEMACRACGKTGMPLTVVWKKKENGSFYPAEGVCHRCTRKPAAAEPATEVIFIVARFQGYCKRCGETWITGDDIAGVQDERGRLYLCVECGKAYR